ncbi:MAG: hypothetical protein KAJ55_11775 [Anaerolineales bacterium]|nr:hypothetical protein [Anaerolineales bacterium]
MKIPKEEREWVRRRFRDRKRKAPWPTRMERLLKRIKEIDEYREKHGRFPSGH